jgi:pyruvate dehydrogenase E2 component (dihydrolipoamide acetyltransferase)
VTEFKLPELGENIEQGDIVRLMIAPGNTVNEGQPVMELDTDKAVVEVPSSVAGVVKDVRVKEGDKLKVGQVIFTVENGAGTRSKSAEAPAKQSRPSAPSAHTGAPSPGTEAASDRLTAPEPAPSPERGIPEADAPAVQSRSSVASGGTATEFRLPELGENIEQGDLVRIMISAGA